MSVLEELLEDLQSSRRKFELEHSEGVINTGVKVSQTEG